MYLLLCKVGSSLVVKTLGHPLKKCWFLFVPEGRSIVAPHRNGCTIPRLRTLALLSCPALKQGVFYEGTAVRACLNSVLLL